MRLFGTADTNPAETGVTGVIADSRPGAILPAKLSGYCPGFRLLSRRLRPKGGITAPAYAIVMSLRLQIRFIFEYN